LTGLGTSYYGGTLVLPPLTPERARGAALALIVVLAFLAAGCGETGKSRADQLAASLQDVVDDDITAGPAYSVLDANCTPRGARYRCSVAITTTPDAIEERFSVRLRGNGCWTATRIGLGVAAGRELHDEERTSRVLKGCIDGGR
jgi:hypothetical protein